jgi:isopenicillin-N N-acyltransferase-like protein
MKQFPATHLLTLTGSPRQRGRAHGESLRPQIRDLLVRWKDFLAWTHGISPREYLLDFISQINFSPAIEKWTPGLLDEVRGIAEGAAVDFSDIYALQLQDEEWWFGQERKQQPAAAANACSSLAWRGDARHPSLVAQNMDLPDYLHDYQVILRIQQDHQPGEVLVFSVAGLIALNGMNSSPLAIVCNNLSQLNHTPRGLPVAFVMRGALAQGSFDQAHAFLRAIPHASGQNYILGSPSQIIDLECSANQVVPYAPDGHTCGVCHTNHPFTNRDYHPSLAIPEACRAEIQARVEAQAVNSHTRFQALSTNYGAVEWLAMDPEAVRRLLSLHGSQEHPVCRHPGTSEKWSTLGATIMQLSAPAYFYICPGPPCTSKFTEFIL